MSVDVHVLPPPTDWWTVSAAWMQAIGSVVAIFVSVWISRSDERKAAARRRQDRIDQISLIQGAANDAYLHIEQVAASIRDEDVALKYRHFDASISQALGALLLRCRVEDLRDPTAAAAVIGLAAEVAAAAGYAKMAGVMMQEHGYAWPIMEDDVNEWTTRAHSARNSIVAMSPDF